MSEGTLAPPGKYDWTCASFGPPESTTQTANRSVQPFLHSSRHKVPILYNGRPFPQKIAPSRGGIWPPSNSWFLAPDRAYSPNGILIVSAVFARGHRKVSLYFTMGRAYPPQNCPFPSGDLDPYLIHGSHGPPESSTQIASRSVQPL